MRERLRNIAIIARQELESALRARLVLAFGGVFALLSLIIALAGLGASGQLLVQGFTRTAASLLNLTIYLLPLVGLITAAATLGGEDGGTELLLAQPIERLDALLGRTLGLSLAVWAVALIGFALTGILVFFLGGSAGIGGYLLVLGAGLLVSTAGVGLGVLLGVAARRRSTAIGYALACWFVLAVLYDLIAIGVLQLIGDGQPGPLLLALLAANPIDGLRALSLVWLGADVLLGPTGSALQQMMSLTSSAILVLASALLSIILPVAAASLVYRHKDF